MEKDAKYMIVRTLTGINVCSHWIRDDFTVTPIRSSEFLKTFIVNTNFVFYNKTFKIILKLLRKGNKQLTLGRLRLKDPRSRLAPVAEVNAF